MTPADEQRFHDFVRDRGDALLRFARLLVPDALEAEDLSEVDTAALMACSPGTVKSNLARGLANLRAALAQSDAAPVSERTVP